MRFYNQQHPFYCGIDLHTRKMYCCIVDQAGQVLVHRNLPTRSDRFLDLIAPYRDGLVVGVECMFSWYWLAPRFPLRDVCYATSRSLGKRQSGTRRLLSF